MARLELEFELQVSIVVPTGQAICATFVRSIRFANGTAALRDTRLTDEQVAIAEAGFKRLERDQDLLTAIDHCGLPGDIEFLFLVHERQAALVHQQPVLRRRNRGPDERR